MQSHGTATADRDLCRQSRARPGSASPSRRSRGVTRRRRVHESGSLRVRFPGHASRRARSGDGQHRRAAWPAATPSTSTSRSARRRRLVVTTRGGREGLSQRSARRRASTSSIDGRAGAALAWLPQETILFDQRAAASRAIEVELAAGRAACCWSSRWCSAAPAWARRCERGALRDRWRVRRDGRLDLRRRHAARRRHRANARRAARRRRRRRDRDAAGRAGR